MTKRILLVDNDDLVRLSLADQLDAKGFVVIQACSAAQALVRPFCEVDVTLIDAKLADASAVELVKALRAEGVGCPIIILGAAAEDVSAWQDAGVTEGLDKPFRFGALLQRLEGHFREPGGEAGLRIGAFRFHPLARLIVDGAGRQLRLTEKESAILAYLHRAGERVVPRHELLGEVWGYASEASTHTVETHIYRLRRKLDADDGDSVLRTEDGGYRLSSSRAT